jgi:formylglycine-generating enzyme required for sulfatase activity
MVRVSAFFLGKYEVTNAQFERFVKARRYRTSAESMVEVPGGQSIGGVDLIRRTEPPFDRYVYAYGVGSRFTWHSPYLSGEKPDDGAPVVQVSWEDARAYCEWAGLQLPTEAQWERAASRWNEATGMSCTYPWGEEAPGPTSGKLANFADKALRLVQGYGDIGVFAGYEDGFAKAAPVGSFEKDRSPVGALDMAGNVCELCRDEWDPKFYSKEEARVRDPCCVHGVVEEDARFSTWHVRRGGDWWTGDDWKVLVGRRYTDFLCFSDTGFRVAFTRGTPPRDAPAPR